MRHGRIATTASIIINVVRLTAENMQNRVTTTLNGTAENILWNSCYLLMKQLLSIGETVVPCYMQQSFHAYCTLSIPIVHLRQLRWYDSDNGDCCSKISAFLMKKQRLSATNLPQSAKKRLKTGVK